MLVEVMGRDCGYLALMAGITGGAEAVLIPEYETQPEEVVREIRRAYERGNRTPSWWWPRAQDERAGTGPVREGAGGAAGIELR